MPNAPSPTSAGEDGYTVPYILPVHLGPVIIISINNPSCNVRFIPCHKVGELHYTQLVAAEVGPRTRMWKLVSA